MTDLRGWGLPEQHLALDAVVAFVDGELSSTAHERAAAHIQSCGFCAFEAYTQQQARAVVRSAPAPTASASLLDRLGAIPQEVELPSAPDGLAITEDGQFVAVQRTDKPGFGSGPVLGSSRPLGSNGWFSGRRARQGAGVVVSGMLLSALAFTTADGGEAPAPAPAPQNAGAVFATTP